MQIHVTEEARHICFASRYLTEHVPRLGVYRRAVLRLCAPFVVGGTMMEMMPLPRDVVRAHRVPREVVRHVHGGRDFREQVVESLRPVYVLCMKLGLAAGGAGRLWNWLGLASSRPALA
jgi:hypothetical protein